MDANPDVEMHNIVHGDVVSCFIIIRCSWKGKGGFDNSGPDISLCMSTKFHSRLRLAKKEGGGAFLFFFL